MELHCTADTRYDSQKKMESIEIQAERKIMHALWTHGGCYSLRGQDSLSGVPPTKKGSFGLTLAVTSYD